jgi:hypothetical protein
MTENELKNWFLNMFYSCYHVKHDDYPDRIYFFYDKLYLRKCVLLNILGKEIEPPKEVRGDCLFILDSQTNYLWCDYDNIWSIIQNNNCPYLINVQALIKIWMFEDDNLNTLIPGPDYVIINPDILEYQKLNISKMFMKNKSFNKLEPRPKSIYFKYTLGELDENMLNIII